MNIEGQPSSPDVDTRELHILYNATSAQVGGGLSYALAQISGLRSVFSDGTITVLATSTCADSVRKIGGVNVELVPPRSILARVIWEQAAVPFRARRYDVVISPGNIGLLLCPKPQIVVLQNPNYVGNGRRLPQNIRLRRFVEIPLCYWSLRRADAVAVISEALMAEVSSERWLQNIHAYVIRSGAPARTVPADEQYHEEIGRPYILSVANGYPHKRLVDLSAAFAMTTCPGSLVYVGSISPAMRSAILERSGSRAKDIVFCGVVTDRSHLGHLYKGARLAVSTSELEAFPLTPHEAGIYGCPLLLTDIAPHREVADAHARYIGVGDIRGTALELQLALSTPRIDTVWSWPITWEEHGEALLRVVQEVSVDRPRPPAVAHHLCREPTVGRRRASRKLSNLWRNRL